MLEVGLARIAVDAHDRPARDLALVERRHAVLDAAPADPRLHLRVDLARARKPSRGPRELLGGRASPIGP